MLSLEARSTVLEAKARTAARATPTASFRTWATRPSASRRAWASRSSAAAWAHCPVATMAAVTWSVGAPTASPIAMPASWDGTARPARCGRPACAAAEAAGTTVAARQPTNCSATRICWATPAACPRSLAASCSARRARR
ncbi:hypothetical protein [Streptomyces sp. JNUCC 63]